ALVPEELSWPRVVRRAFSDPQVPHESTGIHGRGTAEVKTNDITDRVRQGEAGFVVEFGRPGVGARFRDIELVTRALAELGVEFEANNPVTSLMTDSSRGVIRPEILNEKVLSAIVEIKTSLEEVPSVLRKIKELAREVETVISVGVSTRCDAAGQEPLQEILQREGYPTYRGKTNLGLGRLTYGVT
ncbi:MAG: 4Fe-4S ferredoxin, partial [Candidatus Binatia bacterium]